VEGIKWVGGVGVLACVPGGHGAFSNRERGGGKKRNRAGQEVLGERRKGKERKKGLFVEEQMTRVCFFWFPVGDKLGEKSGGNES